MKADQKQPVVQKQTQKVSSNDSVQELPESILRQYQEFFGNVQMQNALAGGDRTVLERMIIEHISSDIMGRLQPSLMESNTETLKELEDIRSHLIKKQNQSKQNVPDQTPEPSPQISAPIKPVAPAEPTPVFKSTAIDHRQPAPQKTAPVSKAPTPQVKALTKQKTKKPAAEKSAEKQISPERKKALDGKASTLFKAMDGWGTDEESIFSTLKGLSPADGKYLKEKYSRQHGQSLRSHFRDELGDDEYDRAIALLSGNRVTAVVATIKERLGFFNDDEQGITAALRSLSPEEQGKLREMAKKDPQIQAVLDKVRGSLDGEDLGTFVAITTENITRPETMSEERYQDLHSRSSELFSAMEGMGTDEEKIHTSLRGLSPEEIILLEDIYARQHAGMSLREQLKSELGSADLDQTDAAMDGDAVQTTIETLKNSIGFFNDDETTIKTQLRSLSSAQLLELHKRIGDDPALLSLVGEVQNALGGEDLEIANTFLTVHKNEQGNVVAQDTTQLGIDSDAISLFHSMDGMGTDEGSVLKQLEGRTPEQIEALKIAYLARAEKDAGDGEKTLSLEDQIKDEFNHSGDERVGLFNGADHQGDIALGLLSGDKVAVRAAKIEEGADGWFFGGGTDERSILKELRGLTPEERTALNTEYQAKYGRSLMDMVDSEFGNSGQGGMAAIAHQTLEKGDADPVLKLQVAMDGFGTDEELLQEALKGPDGEALTQTQVSALKDRFRREYGMDLEDRIDGDIGGTEFLDARILLRGKPESPEDYRQIAQMKHDFQRDSMASGTMDVLGWTGLYDSANVFDYQKGLLDEEVNQWEQGGSKEIPKDVSQALGFFNDGFKSYEVAKNELSNAAATGASIVAAIALTVATGGAGAPLLAGQLAALGMSSSVATMTAVAMVSMGSSVAGTVMKASIKGNSYTPDEAMKDMAMTLLSGVTAAGSSHILRIAKANVFLQNKDSARRYLFANSNRITSYFEMVAQLKKGNISRQMLGHVLGGLPDNLISETVSAMMKDGNWERDGALIEDLLLGTVLASGSGLVGTAAGKGSSKLLDAVGLPSERNVIGGVENVEWSRQRQSQAVSLNQALSRSLGGRAKGTTRSAMNSAFAKEPVQAPGGSTQADSSLQSGGGGMQTEEKSSASKQNVEQQISPERKQELGARTSVLFDAMDGLGTDEETIFTVLQGLSPAEGTYLMETYSHRYRRNLRTHLNDELASGVSGDQEQYERAIALLSGN